MKYILLTLTPLIMLILAGCKPPMAEDEAFFEDDATEESTSKYLVIGDEQESVSSTPAEVAVQDTAKTPDPKDTARENSAPEENGIHDPASGNPNWKARYEELKAERRARFQEPALNKAMKFYMKNGSVKSGTLVSLNNTGAEIELAAGTARFGRQLFESKTRISLWADDYALYYAKKITQKEKDDYELALKKEAAQAEAELLKSDREAMAAKLREGRPVNNKQDRGSVQQVKDYLQKTLKHPDTVKYLKWYPVKPGGLKEKEGGTMVRCKYKVQTDSFGEITERKIFFMDKYGKVYQVAGYKEE